MVNQYKRIKTHVIADSNIFLPTTKICVTNRGKKIRDLSTIFDEYIYWGIVLLNGTTLLTQIYHNGSKNRLQTRHTADYVGFCSQVRRYFSLFMRHISQVRRLLSHYTDIYGHSNDVVVIVFPTKQQQCQWTIDRQTTQRIQKNKHPCILHCYCKILFEFDTGLSEEKPCCQIYIKAEVLV